MDRLQTIAPELAQRLSNASPNARRRASLVAAGFAISTARLNDSEVLRLLSELRSANALRPGVDAWLAALIETLDDAAWQIQDQVDAGTASPAEYLQAFARARAAASLAYAAAGDTSECVYEAAATTQDPASLWALLDVELSTT